MSHRRLSPPARLQPDQLLDESRHRRAAAAVKYLTVAAELGRLVDQLGELHAELHEDDALHQALHALSFTWQYFEHELLIVAAPGRN